MTDPLVHSAPRDADNALEREEALLLGRPSDGALDDALLRPTPRLTRIHRGLLAFTALGTLMLFAAIGYTLVTGIGVWGDNVPVGWSFAIINFVWWIGIGHAGTFISAILLLLEQRWRTSINRIAESMTIFALLQAGLFPLLHLGRAWFFYWLVPYPATTEVWPNFLSVLTWDAAAVFTYTTVSVLFWYLGLLPDLAALRDRATSTAGRWIYGVLCLGWRGSARHWAHYKKAQLLLAGLATPLVLSVHSIVSMDFATALLPGWHSTVFPPYFVAGAIFSGFAMVLTLLIPIRHVFGLQRYITKRHIDLCAQLMLATGLVVAYAYVFETFMAWYSGVPDERRMLLDTRPQGPYAPIYWTMIVCNAVVIHALWSRRIRQSEVAVFIIAILVNVGMWAERFVLIVTSLHRDFLSSSWDVYRPSLTEAAIFLGTLSFFFLLFLLLLRFVPFVPVFELKELRRALDEEPRDE